MIDIITPSSKRHRDLTVIDLNERQTLVVACDSAGGIGPKAGDVIRASGYILGRLTTRVALMEVLSVGASPICVVNTLCVEPVPTGEEISIGVADEISILGINPETVLTGSTEKNIPTIQSGIGITVIGLADKDKLRICSPTSGDVIALVGLPKVGPEVQLDDDETVDLLTVQTLLTSANIKEIVPVGSRGIKAEVESLASIYKMKFSWENTIKNIDLKKSAGPSTCLIAVGDIDALNKLSRKINKPYNILGSFSAYNRC